ncbi:uncharacterized protein LOC121858500 [Homarus americanus]|nr:uncharacterized protein LOC121858500 [Homarus americanus]XP_042210869.1 uncharacterized protein LOC121858500 [Homarus americanus]
MSTHSHSPIHVEVHSPSSQQEDIHSPSHQLDVTSPFYQNEANPFLSDDKISYPSLPEKTYSPSLPEETHFPFLPGETHSSQHGILQSPTLQENIHIPSSLPEDVHSPSYSDNVYSPFSLHNSNHSPALHENDSIFNYPGSIQENDSNDNSLSSLGEKDSPFHEDIYSPSSQLKNVQAYASSHEVTESPSMFEHPHMSHQENENTDLSFSLHVNEMDSDIEEIHSPTQSELHVEEIENDSDQPGSLPEVKPSYVIEDVADSSSEHNDSDIVVIQKSSNVIAAESFTGVNENEDFGSYSYEFKTENLLESSLPNTQLEDLAESTVLMNPPSDFPNELMTPFDTNMILNTDQLENPVIDITPEFELSGALETAMLEIKSPNAEIKANVSVASTPESSLESMVIKSDAEPEPINVNPLFPNDMHSYQESSPDMIKYEASTANVSQSCQLSDLNENLENTSDSFVSDWETHELDFHPVVEGQQESAIESQLLEQEIENSDDLSVLEIKAAHSFDSFTVDGKQESIPKFPIAEKDQEISMVSSEFETGPVSHPMSVFEVEPENNEQSIFEKQEVTSDVVAEETFEDLKSSVVEQVEIQERILDSDIKSGFSYECGGSTDEVDVHPQSVDYDTKVEPSLDNSASLLKITTEFTLKEPKENLALTSLSEEQQNDDADSPFISINRESPTDWPNYEYLRIEEPDSPAIIHEENRIFEFKDSQTKSDNAPLRLNALDFTTDSPSRSLALETKPYSPEESCEFEIESDNLAKTRAFEVKHDIFDIDINKFEETETPLSPENIISNQPELHSMYENKEELQDFSVYTDELDPPEEPHTYDNKLEVHVETFPQNTNKTQTESLVCMDEQKDLEAHAEIQDLGKQFDFENQHDDGKEFESNFENYLAEHMLESDEESTREHHSLGHLPENFDGIERDIDLVFKSDSHKFDDQHFTLSTDMNTPSFSRRSSSERTFDHFSAGSNIDNQQEVFKLRNEPALKEYNPFENPDDNVNVSAQDSVLLNTSTGPFDNISNTIPAESSASLKLIKSHTEFPISTDITNSETETLTSQLEGKSNIESFYGNNESEHHLNFHMGDECSTYATHSDKTKKVFPSEHISDAMMFEIEPDLYNRLQDTPAENQSHTDDISSSPVFDGNPFTFDHNHKRGEQNVVNNTPFSSQFSSHDTDEVNVIKSSSFENTSQFFDEPIPTEQTSFRQFSQTENKSETSAESFPNEDSQPQTDTSITRIKSEYLGVSSPIDIDYQTKSYSITQENNSDLEDYSTQGVNRELNKSNNPFDSGYNNGSNLFLEENVSESSDSSFPAETTHTLHSVNGTTIDKLNNSQSVNSMNFQHSNSSVH